MKRQDLTKFIERLEVFEDRLGIFLEGLYATADDSSEDGWITINGEVHPAEGTQITDDIEIIFSMYDSSGHVLRTDSVYIDAESFFGFQVFSMNARISSSGISKIRVFPKKR